MNKNVSVAIRDLRDSLVKFVNGGEYNVTKELHAEINGITSALDSLKLDYMFLANSGSWRKQFNQEALKMDQASILNLMEKGQLMLKELMMHLSKQLAPSLQENQARKIHFIAKEKLRFFLKSIHPFSHGAYVRLNNYTMDQGLKDRYATIKNELNARTQEPQEPLKAWIDWTDKTLPEQPRFQTPDWREHTYGLKLGEKPNSSLEISWRYPKPSKSTSSLDTKKVCKKLWSCLDANKTSAKNFYNKKIPVQLDFEESSSNINNLDMKRNANKSSCTNKNESGNYFLSSRRYNFHSATPSMYQKVAFVTSESEQRHLDGNGEQTAASIRDSNHPSLASMTHNDSTTEQQQQQNQHQHQQQQQYEQQLDFEQQQRQRILANSSQLSNARTHTVLSMYDKNRNSQMSIRAPSSFGTVESVHAMNPHTVNWRKHALEAGINLNVPGNSEHQYRYTSPVKANYKHFVLNPQQETRLLKRPFLLADYDQITSEYRQRFMFPNKNQIDKFPWIKPTLNYS